jgi:hypothetical protein
MVQANLGKKQHPISKITRGKRAGAQAVELLPHKCSSTTRMREGLEGWRVGGSERKKNYIELQLDPALKRSLVFP